MEAPPIERRTQGVIALLIGRVVHIRYHEQPDVEEYLLGLALSDTVLFTLARVPVIPIEADDPVEVNHDCILPSYTTTVKSMDEA